MYNRISGDGYKLAIVQMLPIFDPEVKEAEAGMAKA